jgi:glutathione-regulated potassium-efflux system ancillary protein KefC
VHLAALLLIKVALIYRLCLWFGTARAVALRVAFQLGQAGEFGFVLFGAAKALGIIDDRTFVLAVAVISLSMLATPLLTRLGNRLAGDAADDVDEHFHYGPAPAAGNQDGPRVVIAGYGRVGHTIGTILSSHGIDYIAFDPNPALVSKWREEGYPVYYGDIGDPHLLEAARVERADLVVLTIDDPQAAVEATRLIRARSPQVSIVARARDLVACDALNRAGATRAFPEAVEASLKLAAETLNALGISEDETDHMLTDARGKDYALVRSELEVLASVPKPRAEAGAKPDGPA